MPWSSRTNTVSASHSSRSSKRCEDFSASTSTKCSSLATTSTSTSSARSAAGCPRFTSPRRCAARQSRRLLITGTTSSPTPRSPICANCRPCSMHGRTPKAHKRVEAERPVAVRRLQFRRDRVCGCVAADAAEKVARSEEILRIADGQSLDLEDAGKQLVLVDDLQSARHVIGDVETQIGFERNAVDAVIAFVVVSPDQTGGPIAADEGCRGGGPLDVARLSRLRILQMPGGDLRCPLRRWIPCAADGP